MTEFIGFSRPHLARLDDEVAETIAKIREAVRAGADLGAVRIAKGRPHCVELPMQRHTGSCR